MNLLTGTFYCWKCLTLLKPIVFQCVGNLAFLFRGGDKRFSSNPRIFRVLICLFSLKKYIISSIINWFCLTIYHASWTQSKKGYLKLRVIDVEKLSIKCYLDGCFSHACRWWYPLWNNKCGIQSIIVYVYMSPLKL